MSTRIILVGSGSGGHVYPLVAVARELERRTGSGGGVELILMGDKGGFIKRAAAELDRGYIKILSGKWRRYFSLENFTDIFKLPLGFIQSLFYMWLFMPDIVFSKGSYDAFLPVLAARLLFVPVVIHESDSVPGVTNRITARFAKKVLTSFQQTTAYFPGRRVELVGNPTRQTLIGGDRQEALSEFSLKDGKPVVLFLGGSRGARVINGAVLLSIVQLAPHYQVIHQCGEGNYPTVKGQADAIIKDGQGTYGTAVQQSYRVYPFLSERQMNLAYAAADVIVSRAGAGSIFEISAVGKPAIIVPIKESASNHQLINAVEFSKYGAVVIEEDNLTTNILISEINNSWSRRDEIAEGLKQFAKPNAAGEIADRLLGSG